MIYLDFLRIAASLAVILIHVAAENFAKVPLGSYSWNVFVISSALSRWAVPVFVMISGYLFLNPDRSVDIRKLFGKNLLRLITALCFWCAAYATEQYLRGTPVKRAIQLLLSGTTHLWFLYMMIGLYLIVPFLRKITESKKLTEYFLLIGLVFSFVIPRSLSFIQLIVQNDRYGILTSANKVVTNMHFHFTLGFSVYFVLGYYLAKFEIKPVWRGIAYGAGILSLAAIVLLTNWHSFSVGEASELFFAPLGIFVLIMSIAVFLFGKYVIGRLNCGRWSGIVKKLSDYSFGCYLVHILVKNFFGHDLHLNTLTFDPLLSELLLFAGVAILSYFISWLFNKIPLVKKYIV